MARRFLPPHDKSHNGVSADEFQKKLFSWFQDKGLLSDLQAYLRRQMIVALKDTSLSIHSTGSFHQAGSPKLQAINLLVAEFLLQQDYHFTLSVFTSEVPLLRNLPEFANVQPSNSKTKIGTSYESFLGFQENDVQDILEALGLTTGFEECQRIFEVYQNSQGEALLTCLIRSFCDKFHKSNNKQKTEISAEDKLKVILEQHSALLNSPLFTEESRTLILQSALEPEKIVLLHELFRRIIDSEVEKARQEEEEKFKTELVSREHRIQAEWQRQEEAIQKKLEIVELTFDEERENLRKELQQKRAQLSDLASQLREQQNEIANRLNYVQERSSILEQKETELKSLKNEVDELVKKKGKKLDMKEKELAEKIAREEAEAKAKEDKRRQLEADCIRLEKSLKESRCELKLAQELQVKHSAPIERQEELRKPPNEGSRGKKFLSRGVQTKGSDHSVSRGAIPKKQQTERSCEEIALQTYICGTDIEETYLQLRQQTAENDRQRSDHEMLSSLVEHLHQENSELRQHNEKQRQRIQELTARAIELAQQLEEATGSLSQTRLGSSHLSSSPLRPTSPPPPQSSPPPSCPHLPRTVVSSSAHTVQPPSIPSVPPVVPSVPTVFHPSFLSVPGMPFPMFGVQPPPPPQSPSASMRQPLPPPPRNTPCSRQLGAGEDSSFSRRLPPESTRAAAALRDRRKPPRRLMIHSATSSEEASQSPTEDMLREARRRLRRLEEESLAVDRSYREFQQRQAEHLYGCASILFQPLAVQTSRRQQQATPAPPPPPPPPPSHVTPPPSRQQVLNAQVTLLSQLSATRFQPPPVLQPLYSMSRTSEQMHSVLYTSTYPHSFHHTYHPLFTTPATFGAMTRTTVTNTTPILTSHIGRNTREETRSRRRERLLPNSKVQEADRSTTHQQRTGPRIPEHTTSAPLVPFRTQETAESQPLSQNERANFFLDEQRSSQPFNTPRSSKEFILRLPSALHRRNSSDSLRHPESQVHYQSTGGDSELWLRTFSYENASQGSFKKNTHTNKLSKQRTALKPTVSSIKTKPLSLSQKSSSSGRSSSPEVNFASKESEHSSTGHSIASLGENGVPVAEEETLVTSQRAESIFPRMFVEAPITRSSKKDCEDKTSTKTSSRNNSEDSISIKTLNQKNSRDNNSPKTSSRKNSEDKILIKTVNRKNSEDDISIKTSSQKNSGDNSSPKTMSRSNSEQQVLIKTSSRKNSEDNISMKTANQKISGDRTSPKTLRQKESGDNVFPETFHASVSKQSTYEKSLNRNNSESETENLCEDQKDDRCRSEGGKSGNAETGGTNSGPETMQPTEESSVQMINNLHEETDVLRPNDEGEVANRHPPEQLSSSELSLRSSHEVSSGIISAGGFQSDGNDSW